MRILAHVEDDELQESLTAAAAEMGAELQVLTDKSAQMVEIFRYRPDLLLVDEFSNESLQMLRLEAGKRAAALVAACRTAEEAAVARRIGVEEWFLLPVGQAELVERLRGALRRARAGEDPEEAARRAEHLRFEELLYDRFTGFPTLPVMLEGGREILERRGRLTILYLEFVRYSKLEEIYGWQKLDEVLQTTASAVREFYHRQHGSTQNLLMVSHTGDDDFIFFSDLPDPAETAEKRIDEVARALEAHVRQQLEEEHGEDIAGLFEIYIGATTIFRNPKLRAARIIYRGIREAAAAARSVEHRERSRKVADLKETLREGLVYIEYHPIVVAQTAEVYGYEALARGVNRALRSPEVLFGVAEEANLIWELSRLCRRRAIEGMNSKLEPHHLLFLNIDPHDFRDPSFRYLDLDELGVEHPERIVLEITERTAITDYPKFQGYLDEFRARGFRFAVDDAGSGYAGLGSIANLAPDFIKLDISLISAIDTNFMKQNLVETMVNFANDHGIQVIAEGVEREEEYESVKSLGVHLTQGFLFHQPRYLGKQGVDAAPG